MKTTLLTVTLCLLLFAKQSHQIPRTVMEKSIDDMYDRCIEQMRRADKHSTALESTDMKTKMLTVTLCLMFFPMQSQEIPLTPIENSIDDMYGSCIGQMATKVEKVYFPKEKKQNPFGKGWKNAAPCAKAKFKNRPDKALILEQVQAMCVYTQERPNVYGPFNTIVSDGAPKYTTDAFKYHAFHFWLTTALQIVQENKPCHTTFRRSKNKYTGKVNQEMRFGFFASSSTDPDLITFGRESCFYIETCHGADIEYYSSKSEKEVLIPPYEKFKITEIAQGSYKEMKDCKTIFVLKSTGKNQSSNQNCKAI